MRCNGSLTTAAKINIGCKSVGMSDLVTDYNHKTCEVTEPNVPTTNVVKIDGELLTPLILRGSNSLITRKGFCCLLGRL